MIYFLIRVVVNTLAVAIVMNVVPGLRLVPNSALPEPFATSIAYIRIGLIFGALHAVVRPAILFLTNGQLTPEQRGGLRHRHTALARQDGQELGGTATPQPG